MKESIKIFISGDFYAKNVAGLKINPDLQKIIDESDIRIINFEGPIQVDGANKIPKSGPSLAQDPQAPSFLENRGFNVVLLGNNHFMDFGEQAAQKTIDAFNKAVLVGAGCAEEAYSIKKISVKGKRIGFMSFTHKEFGVVQSIDKKNTFGTAWICSPNIKEIIEKEKKDIDLLMVFPHAGIEHIDAPLPEWKEIYKRFIDWGADFVLASHPHVSQGWELYKGHYIYYSLGNFYFDTLSGGKWWYKGLTLEINIDDVISIINHNTKFQNLEIGLDNDKDTKTRNEFLLSLLNDQKLYNDYIFEKSNLAYSNYICGFVRGVNGVLFNVGLKRSIKTMVSSLLKRGNKNTTLNILQCESHRWLFERGIKQQLDKDQK